jgi:tryptophan halogenase
MASAGARAIGTIGVLGGGIVGLSAAIAFARALPQVRVGLIEVPPDPAALADRMPGTLPAIDLFHAAIGLDELDLVQSGAAIHRLGTRFERWSADGEPWYHVFGDYGRRFGSAAFHAVWAAARQAGQALPFHSYAPAAVLAEAGKFVHPSNDARSPLSTFSYGLQLDPDRYRQRLTALSGTLPLLRARGELTGVERREDGGISAIVLKGGQRLEADLFIDCSGPSAPLLSAVGGGFEEWGEHLPCDRLLLASTPSSASAPVDVATATAAGWRWSVPLPGRLMGGLCYASAITGEGRARRVFASEAGVEAAEAVAIRPGRRPEPWVRNVLALGDAAVAVDPLQASNLHLAHNGILRALELLPGRDCHELELAEYNRRTAQETMRVRDFLAVHYLRSGRTKGEFWEKMRGRALPESLAHTLEQFERRGRIPFYEEEVFAKESWHAVLLGMGTLPRHIDPVAAGVRPEDAAAFMERMADGLAGLPERLPAYAAYLAQMARSS